MKALVRCVASSFAQAITMQAPAVAISLEHAVQQHGAYVQLLKNILGSKNVLELAADAKHPGRPWRCLIVHWQHHLTSMLPAAAAFALTLFETATHCCWPCMCHRNTARLLLH